MSAGIISQYGFLFQKYVFIDTVINHASVELFFTYEGVDDIDITHDMDEGLVMVSSSKDTYMQVKSGNVTKECWAKVIGNWILTGNTKTGSFVLISENELGFDITDESTVESVCKYFENGKSERKNAIARKVNDILLKDKNRYEVKEIIKELSLKCNVVVKSLDDIITDLCQKIMETYCSDIKVYNRAKKSRAERLVEYIKAEIDDAIKEKKKYILTFTNLMDIVGRVRSEISDDKYTVDTAALKKRKKKEAETLVENSELREIHQLRLVRDDTEFVTKELINELLYKEFREVYVENGIEISNIEDIAYTNYQDTLFDFDGKPTPKEVFRNTTQKEIYSRIMDNSPIYRHGCYVYLTSKEIEEDKQISWGDDNE